MELVHTPYFVPRAWTICVGEATIVTWVILLKRLAPESTQKNCRSPGCLAMLMTEVLADPGVGSRPEQLEIIVVDILVARRHAAAVLPALALRGVGAGDERGTVEDAVPRALSGCTRGQFGKKPSPRRTGLYQGGSPFTVPATPDQTHRPIVSMQQRIQLSTHCVLPPGT